MNLLQKINKLKTVILNQYVLTIKIILKKKPKKLI